MVGPGLTPAQLAERIDYTLLKADATARDIENLCALLGGCSEQQIEILLGHIGKF